MAIMRLAETAIFAVLCVTAILIDSPARADEAQITSPAVDPTLFRDGEVRRTTRQFGAWTTVCDEISRLRQRFCSLKAVYRDASDQPIAELVVSTGDNGKPAAMLRVGLGAHIGTGARVWLSDPDGSTKARAPGKVPVRRVDFITCDKAGCISVWTFSSEEIRRMNAGATPHVRLARLRPSASLSALIAPQDRLAPIEGAIPGGAFATAVNSTLY